MLVLTDQDDGRTLAARVGDTVELRLSENATAGYSWTAEADAGDVLAAAGAESDYPAAAVGSGGTALFRYTARAPGRARLTFRYGRPWEGAAAATRRFEVTVEVAG